MPNISVIVPVYKVEPYLHRHVDSILSQTYGDFELILVDDGSPDSCGEICDEYAALDSRIHVIHQENGGLSAARNAGLDYVFENSDSKWINFIDSDDWVHETYLEALLTAAEKYSVDISLCGHMDISDGEFPTEKSNFDGEKLFTGKEACMNVYNGGKNCVSYIISCAKLYRKELFTDIRFPVGRIHEDEFTTYKLLYKSEHIAEVGRQLYYYYKNIDGITKSGFTIKRFDAVDAICEAVEFYKKYNEFELAELAEKRVERLGTTYSIEAREAGVYKDVPKQYRISIPKAYKVLLKYCGTDVADWYVHKCSPGYVKMKVYTRKLLKMLFHYDCYKPRPD